jgi:hypothetical protein
MLVLFTMLLSGVHLVGKPLEPNQQLPMGRGF